MTPRVESTMRTDVLVIGDDAEVTPLFKGPLPAAYADKLRESLAHVPALADQFTAYADESAEWAEATLEVALEFWQQ